jgi:hypothetical protein
MAREGFVRCNNFVNGWLGQADSVTGLIPRNLSSGRTIWNAKDAAADNYPFMVLTSYFTNRGLFQGRMLEMLEKEKALTSRVNSMPDTYSFVKGDFEDAEVDMSRIVFGTSEYMKDGLLPLTEWLGESPWYDRMLEMLHDLHDEVDVASGFEGGNYGRASQSEVNGELLQVLSRMYWMSGEDKFLDWAMVIGDYYLLGNHHPTREMEYLRLRDHGCELISGLCELYAAVNFSKPDKKKKYQAPIHEMLDRILEVGRNEHGMFYDGINPITGEIVSEHLADTWGYTLNGYYIVYEIDGKQEYYDAILKIFSNLNAHYKSWDWERGSSDGYADAIESALNLYNRIDDINVAEWIDSEIRVMWGMQQDDGIIEGWHGDGNFARTTIMYNLRNTQGTHIQPWRPDIGIGGHSEGDTLFLSIAADSSWEGKVYFDKKRHALQMNLPMDWTRINQFPEWYTVDPQSTYLVKLFNSRKIYEIQGEKLLSGLPVELKDGENLKILILRTG